MTFNYFQFLTDGYVVIEGFLTDQEVDALKKEAENLIDNIPEKAARAVFSTNDSESKQVCSFIV